MMELVSEAIAFATKAHDGMRRKKCGTPYILHPMEVAALIGTMTSDQAVIAAGALHDVVEDAGITIEQIGERFGERVMALVAAETENKHPELPPEMTWRIRKEESLEVLKATDDIGVLIMWLSDKLSNLRAIYRDFKTEGNAVWQNFHQRDINAQAWYYRSVMQYTRRLSDTLAWMEYKTLVELLFGAEEQK